MAFAYKTFTSVKISKCIARHLSTVPILYYDNISPPCRSVLLVQKALKLNLKTNFVNLFNQEHLSTSFLKVKLLCGFFFLFCLFDYKIWSLQHELITFGISIEFYYSIHFLKNYIFRYNTGKVLKFKKKLITFCKFLKRVWER